MRGDSLVTLSSAGLAFSPKISLKLIQINNRLVKVKPQISFEYLHRLVKHAKDLHLSIQIFTRKNELIRKKLTLKTFYKFVVFSEFNLVDQHRSISGEVGRTRD